MAGSLTVQIIMPNRWTGATGQWRVDGGAWQAGGANVPGLEPGSHDVDFSVVYGTPNPPSQSVVISDGQTTYTAGTYCAIKSETILETQAKGLRETRCRALDAIRGYPLFLAASSLDAAFSAYDPPPYAGPGTNTPGAAYTATKAMEAQYNELYQIMLEGGQVSSDFATDAEIAAIAAQVAPYLTGSQPYVGGVPIRAGYKLVKRSLTSWTIQRGKGFSLQGAIDAGYVSGDCPVNYEDAVPPEVEVGGFIVQAGGQTWPQNNPGANITGMSSYLDPAKHGYNNFCYSIAGYPATGGPNISQVGSIAGAVSIHSVNEDGTINEAVNFYSNTYYITPGLIYTPLFAKSVGGTFQYLDYYNPYTNVGDIFEWSPYFGVQNFAQCFPPQYYIGSPDYTVTLYPPNPPDIVWNGTNAQISTLPFVLIYWLGKSPYDVPQQTFGGPEVVPADRNARFNPFNAEDYNLFWIK